MRIRRLLTPLLSLLLLGAVYAGVPAKITPRGWAPLLRLTKQGGDDPQLALRRLASGADTMGVVLHGLDMDRATRGFLGDVVDSLQDFDLEEFHETLPEKVGSWRRLRIYGKVSGKTYPVRQAPRRLRCRVSPDGPLGATPGDVAINLRSRPVARKDGGSPNYLLQGDMGLGVGAVGWEALTGAFRETALLVASGDRRSAQARRDMAFRAAPKTRLKLLRSHRGLRDEDIEVLGVLWESFPHVGDVLHSVARAEDVLVRDPKGDGSYQQLRLSVRLKPDLLKKRGYKDLAKFLEGLGPLVHVRTVWTDAAGRQLAVFGLSSKDLRLSFECFVRNGRLLALGKDGKVELPKKTERAKTERAKTKQAKTKRAKAKRAKTQRSDERQKLQARVDVAFNVNGMRMRIQQMRMDWTYAKRGRNVDISARITKIPQVRVTGRAFGIVPKWLIDVAIPGNMDQLIREFMLTATQGNVGRGIALDLRLRQARAGGPATISLGGGVELLDSTLIHLAAKIAGQKLIPPTPVRNDLHRLMCRLHYAFVKDLRRYQRLLR